MLNISEKKIRKYIDLSKYPTVYNLENKHYRHVLKKMLIGFFLLFLIVLMLPWTQNIQSRGMVTALLPQQRPQIVPAAIPGRIEKWFVREGEFVKKGDTLVEISEIKSEYLDPDLVQRTNLQLRAKETSAQAYKTKAEMLAARIVALKKARDLKLKQARNKLRQAELKVITDSINLEAAKINYQIADTQYKRMEKMYAQGLKSLKDLEQRKQKRQKAYAYKIAAENKLLASRNKLLNAQIELSSLEAQYREKITKAESDRNSALSAFYTAQAEISKLQVSLANYSLRTQMHYILAPQTGYVVRTHKTGIGETVKAGTPLVSILPEDHELAVELFVKPLDLPLLEKGQKVRIQFDGWPAFVFSGWPTVSYGTYGGEIFAIDRFSYKKGKYRILVKQDSTDHPWPKELRIGSGTYNMILLKDVPIWYEIWRQFNGFPPDYYKESTTDEKTKK